MTEDIIKQNRCDYDQLALLLMCSEIKDSTPWNEWRDQNRDSQIWLEGADLRDAHIEGVSLYMAHLQGAKLHRAHLEGADLTGAHLEKANLAFAHLEEVEFTNGFHFAHLEDTRFDYTNLRRANLAGTHIERGQFYETNLEEVFFFETHLENAKFVKANLAGANFTSAHLEGAVLSEVQLEGANFSMTYLDDVVCHLASVDGKTVLMPSSFTKKTLFIGVGLDSIVIEPVIKEALKNNTRRFQWKSWMKSGCWFTRILKQMSKLFWLATDYGSSTIRIVIAFMFFAFLFAGIYFGFETIPWLNSVHPEIQILDRRRQ